MKITDLDRLEVSAFTITGKGKHSLIVYLEIFDPYRMSEFARIRGLDRYSSRILTALFTAGNPRCKLRALMERSGISSILLRERMEYLLREKYVRATVTLGKD